MVRRAPISTRTDTLFPNTRRFRSIGRDVEKRSDIAAKQRFRRDVEHQRRGRIETLDTSAGVQDDHPVLGAVEDRFLPRREIARPPMRFSLLPLTSSN